MSTANNDTDVAGSGAGADFSTGAALLSGVETRATVAVPLRSDGGAPATVVTASLAPAASATAPTVIAGSANATAPTAIGGIAAAETTACDPAAVLDRLVGQTIGGCIIEALLGRGGMGAVFRATQVSLGRHVALKVMLPGRDGDPQFADRFVREARLVAALNHPHIVQVFEAGRDPATGMLYMLMEFVSGKTLGQVIKRQGALPAPLALEIMRQAMDGLRAAHAKSLIHRDLKPDNLMIADDGRVKVMDFGLARQSDHGGDSGLTMSGMILGTPSYMSPEAARGQPSDIRSDIYSMGVTLWQAIAGKLPFTAATPVQVMAMHLDTPPPALRSVMATCPPAVAELTARMLAKDANARPATPKIIADDIAAVQRQLGAAFTSLSWNGDLLQADCVMLPHAAAGANPPQRARRWWLHFIMWPTVLAAGIVAAVMLLPATSSTTSGGTSGGGTSGGIGGGGTGANSDFGSGRQPPNLIGAGNSGLPMAIAATASVGSQSIPTPTAAIEKNHPPILPAAQPSGSVLPVTVTNVNTGGVQTVMPAQLPTQTPVTGQPVDAPGATGGPEAIATPATPIEAPTTVAVVSKLPASLFVSSAGGGPADILVNGTKRGTTPARILNLTPGECTVTLRGGDGAEVTTTVVLLGGRVNRLDAPLLQPSVLELRGIPAGASVTVEGVAYRSGMRITPATVTIVVKLGDTLKAYRAELTAGINTVAVP